MKQVIPFTNTEAWLAHRARDVTSTESAALFDSSPYDTLFSLWHRKRAGAVTALEPTERMDWGTDLQDVIAASLAKRQNVTIERITDYMRLSNTRMGASFDFRVSNFWAGASEASALTLQFMDHGPGLLEIKNVDAIVFNKTWPKLDDGTLEAPAHIEIQLQHQLHVAGYKWGAIGVLVGGNRGYILIRDYYPEVGQEIEAKIADFWRSIDEGKEPDPNYPADAGAVLKLFGKVTPGAIHDGRGNLELDRLLHEYKTSAECAKLAEEDKKIAHAKILRIIGDAERCYADNYTITAGMVKGTHIEYDRAAYRNFKVTEKK